MCNGTRQGSVLSPLFSRRFVSTTDCISFNYLKYANIVFLNRIFFNLLIPHITFNSEILKPSTDVKYFGYKLNAKLSDEDDVLKEMRTWYMRSYILIRTFSKCKERAKIQLFKS